MPDEGMVADIEDDRLIGEDCNSTDHHGHDLRWFSYRIGEDQPEVGLEVGLGLLKLAEEKRAARADDVHSRKEPTGLRFSLQGIFDRSDVLFGHTFRSEDVPQVNRHAGSLGVLPLW